MGVYRLLIVLIWLSVPIAAYFFVQSDRERFNIQSLEQRADCLDREEAIRRYSRLMSLRSVQVHNITNADTRADWRSRFAQITREMENELVVLRGETPVHYPGTDLLLLELEQRLKKQQESIEEAARNRNAYVAAGRDIEDQARNIQVGRDTANYYRSIGAFSIADLIDEDVDIQERQFNKQVQERNRRAELVQESLDRADGQYEAILRELDRIDACLAEDEKLTYQTDLQRRFDEFNLRAELERLMGIPEVSEINGREDTPPQPTSS